MRDNCSHVASFLDATTNAGCSLIQKMEQLRPDPPITTITLRPLRRLSTGPSRQKLLGSIPEKTYSQNFLKGVEVVEKWQWVHWHRAMALDTHMHLEHRADMRLRKTVIEVLTISALKVRWGHGISDCISRSTHAGKSWQVPDCGRTSAIR